MVAMLLFLACRSECEKGFERHDDGLCYEVVAQDTATAGADSGGDTGAAEDSAEPAAPTVEDVLAALPACVPGATDGRLDLQHGCADDVCVGDAPDQAVATLGEPDEIYEFSYSYNGYESGSLYYVWAIGLELIYEDDDQDGVPDTTIWSSPSAYALMISLPWDGGTSDGLGLGASLSCFVDAFGTPGSVDFDFEDYKLYPTYLSWDVDYYSSMNVQDRYLNKTGEYGAYDGFVDGVTFYYF